MNKFWDFLKTYRGTLFYVGLMLLIGLKPHGGGMVFAMGGLGLFALLIRFVASIRNPVLLRQRAISFAMIFGVSAVLGLWQLHLANAYRAAADQLVSDVERYRQAHGAYPPKLEALGNWDRARFRKELGMGSYLLYEGKPSLFYASTFMPFDTWDYDFEQRFWTYDAD